jgi:hypothetical protein
VTSAAAAATQPAYEASTALAQPEMGKGSSGSRVGLIVIVILLLVIAGAGAMLWLRQSPSSGSSTNKVLIVTPSPASLTIEPNATATLSVAVEGDGGAGMSWKVAENYGGTVQPAGVSVQGPQVIYKATYHSGQTPGDYHVVATSAANKDVKVSITVHVAR